MTQAKGKSLPSHKVIALSEHYAKENDGVDHINILFRKAQTSLGRNLSHFARIGFIHPYFGQFVSMEGFWFWTRSGRTGDQLRYLSGYDAKKSGRELTPNWTPHFKEDIMAGNYQKIIQNQHLYDEMVNSELPFTHYYLMRPHGYEERKARGEFDHLSHVPEIKVAAKEESWLCAGFEDLRTALKEGRTPDCWINAEKRYIQEFEASSVK